MKRIALGTVLIAGFLAVWVLGPMVAPVSPTSASEPPPIPAEEISDEEADLARAISHGVRDTLVSMGGGG